MPTNKQCPLDMTGGTHPLTQQYGCLAKTTTATLLADMPIPTGTVSLSYSWIRSYRRPINMQNVKMLLMTQLLIAGVAIWTQVTWVTSAVSTLDYCICWMSSLSVEFCSMASVCLSPGLLGASEHPHPFLVSLQQHCVSHSS